MDPESTEKKSQMLAIEAEHPGQRSDPRQSYDFIVKKQTAATSNNNATTSIMIKRQA